MRHRYETDAIVIGRTPLGEESALIILLTRDLGLVRARAQSVRRSGAKLAAALVTLSESRVTLVRGKEGWRLAGAVLIEQYLGALPDAARIGRFTSLVQRLVGGDTRDHQLYLLLRAYIAALMREAIEHHEALEMIAALALLEQLGLATSGFHELGSFQNDVITSVEGDRKTFLTRINEGIAASGL